MEEDNKNEIYYYSIKNKIKQIKEENIKIQLITLTNELIDVIKIFHQNQNQMKSVISNLLNMLLIEIIQTKQNKKINEIKIMNIINQIENNFNEEFLELFEKIIQFCSSNEKYFEPIFNFYNYIVFDIQHYFDVFPNYDENANFWLEGFKEILKECSEENDEEKNKETNDEFDDIILFEDVEAKKIIKTKNKNGDVTRMIEGEIDFNERFENKHFRLNELRMKSEKEIKRLNLYERDTINFNFINTYLNTLQLQPQLINVSHESESVRNETFESVTEEKSEKEITKNENQTNNTNKIENNNEIMIDYDEKFDSRIIKMQQLVDKMMKEKEDNKKIKLPKSIKENHYILDKNEKIIINPVVIQNIIINENSIVFQKQSNDVYEIIDARKGNYSFEYIFNVLDYENRKLIFVYSNENELIEDENLYESIKNNFILKGGNVIEYECNIHNYLNNFLYKEYIVVSPSNRISCCKLKEKNKLNHPHSRLYYPIKIEQNKEKYYLIFHNYLRKRNENDLICFHIINK